MVFFYYFDVLFVISANGHQLPVLCKCKFIYANFFVLRAGCVKSQMYLYFHEFQLILVQENSNACIQIVFITVMFFNIGFWPDQADPVPVSFGQFFSVPVRFRFRPNCSDLVTANVRTGQIKIFRSHQKHSFDPSLVLMTPCH